MTRLPLNPQSVLGRAQARERPYTAFARHLEPDPVDTASTPAPVDPGQRVTAETIALLAEMATRLAAAQAQVLAHLPDAVRLKLARLVNGTALSAEASKAMLERYQAFGALATPRSNAPSRRRKPKPRS